jgi:hypothetical protein
MTRPRTLSLVPKPAKKKPGRKDEAAGAESSRKVSSPDGTFEFLLRRTASGVHVERTHVRSGTSRTSHAMMFQSVAAFERFVDADEIRFLFPITCLQVKRECHELFALEP